MIKKTLIAATVATAFALPAHAGGVSDPIMDPQIIIQDVETQSSGSSMLPIIIFAMFIAAATAGS